MPAPSSSTPPVVPTDRDPAVPVGTGSVGRTQYLNDVMAEIDAEVRRRRSSGDLPAGLEQELDELFLEFSPVGLHGKARLRETLALVDGSAYVDMAVPVESQKAVGSYVKRAIRQSITWYMGFIVHQIVRFAWAVSRMFHVLVDHVEDLEAAVETQRTPELPASVVPAADPGAGWWAADAVRAVSGVEGRVLQADCGNGSLVDALLAAGIDAYGVDGDETVIEPALDRGLDVRAEPILAHLEVVAGEALSGMVLTGSIEWLHPNERDRLVDMAASRLALDGVLVVHSATPESWLAGTAHLLSDLAPGRPLHAETWSHLLAEHGFRRTGLTYGGADRRLERVAGTNPDAPAINAAIDTVNALLLGPGEYVLVAVRER
ncbi:MAG: class I SAM-dependent methyltransferase [Acidimicrobiales bacterium]